MRAAAKSLGPDLQASAEPKSRTPRALTPLPARKTSASTKKRATSSAKIPGSRRRKRFAALRLATVITRNERRMKATKATSQAT